ncbi:MAG: hypothetical protein GF334_09885 [Candidatus Altiarchaeales archaeon]|nr:hypothetical protein [Candidatus Altiarchaeales archaeon]
MSDRKLDWRHAITASEMAIVIREAYRAGDDETLVNAIFKGFPLSSLRRELGEKFWGTLSSRTLPYFRRLRILETSETYPDLNKLDWVGMKKPLREEIEKAAIELTTFVDTFPDEGFSFKAREDSYEEICLEIFGQDKRFGVYFTSFDKNWLFIDASKTPPEFEGGRLKDLKIIPGKINRMLPGE